MVATMANAGSTSRVRTETQTVFGFERLGNWRIRAAPKTASTTVAVAVYDKTNLR